MPLRAEVSGGRIYPLVEIFILCGLATLTSELDPRMQTI
jgi:hypothetical protein